MYDSPASLFPCRISQVGDVEICKCGAATRWSLCQPGSLADYVPIIKWPELFPSLYLHSL